MIYPDSFYLQYLMPHISLSIHRICTPGWKLAEQICTVHNLLLVYEGEGEFHCNDKKYKGIRGILIYYKPGDKRCILSSEQNPMKYYTINFHYTCPVYKNGQWELYNLQLPFEPLNKIEDPYLLLRLSDLFSSLTRIWASGSQNRILRCRSLFIDIISQLLSWQDENNTSYDKLRKVEKVIHFITKHYAEKLSLKDIADVGQISPSYLGAIFSQVTGRSPIDFLIDFRVSRARELLKDGYSVSETADLVGFNDIYYFSKCFKKREGIGPSQFSKNTDTNDTIK